MMRRRFLLPHLVLGCILFSSLFTKLEAQSTWLEPRGERGLYLEWLKPSFGDGDLTFITSTLYLVTHWSLTEGLALNAELPFAHAGIDSEFGDFSSNTVGNPYLGIEVGSEESSVLGELGVRLPLTPNPDNFEDELAVEVGAYSDLVDRWEAFLPDVLSLHSALNYQYRGAYGFGVRARLAPVLWLDTGDGLRDDTELLLQYGVQAGVDLESVIFNGGFSGRALITEADLDFGERTLHQLVLAGQAKLGRYRPGLQVRLPLDEDYADLVDIVIAFSFGIQLQ